MHQPHWHFSSFSFPNKKSSSPLQVLFHYLEYSCPCFSAFLTSFIPLDLSSNNRLKFWFTWKKFDLHLWSQCNYDVSPVTSKCDNVGMINYWSPYSIKTSLTILCKLGQYHSIHYLYKKHWNFLLCIYIMYYVPLPGRI